MRGLKSPLWSAAARGYATATAASFAFAGKSPVSPAEAVQHIASRSRVYVHGFSATPRHLLAALAERDDLDAVELVHYGLQGANPAVDAPNAWHSGKQRFWVNNIFVGPSLRKAVEEGRSSYVPIFVSEVPIAIRSGALKMDAALLTVSPPDENGNCSIGLEATAGAAAAETAQTIIGTYLYCRSIDSNLSF